MHVVFYYLIVVLIAAIDQITKFQIVSQLELFDRIPVIDGIFTITHIRNTGAAYNLLSQVPWLLIIVPGLVMLAGLVFLGMRYKQSPRLLLMAVSMVIGGGLGNLIDRIAKGYVVDFFDIQIIPVFNMADIFICTGCGLLFIYLIFFDGKKHGEY
jgi:signal peptidase II